MKKLLLIPTTLTALTPLISCLSGCSKDKYAQYKVTDQEMQDALSLKGIEHMQRETTQTTSTVGIVVEYSKTKNMYAPRAYYELFESRTQQIEESQWLESYVFRYSEAGYIRYDRDDPLKEWQDPIHCTPEDLISTKDVGETLLNEFYTGPIVTLGFNYSFDQTKKCYLLETTYIGDQSKTIQLFFENKRIVKIVTQHVIDGATTDTTMEFKYKEISPVPPRI